MNLDMARLDSQETVLPFIARITIDGQPADDSRDVSDVAHLVFPNLPRQEPRPVPGDPWFWYVHVPYAVNRIMARDQGFAWTEAVDDETGEMLVSIEIGMTNPERGL